MTSVLLTEQYRMGWRLPEFAIVIVMSIGGLIISLALAAATWTDGTIRFLTRDRHGHEAAPDSLLSRNLRTPQSYRRRSLLRRQPTIAHGCDQTP